MAEQRKTIRVEDLGEPVQKLLRALKKKRGEMSDEDVGLLEYIGVKDMVMIYQEMGSSDDKAEEIWNELKAALIARREKARRKTDELANRAKDIDAERAQAEEEARRLQEEQDAANAAAEKAARKAERKRAKAAAAAAAAAEEEKLQYEAELKAAEEEEAARLAEEAEAERRRRERKQRREEKAKRLQQEMDALEQERSAAKKPKGNGKRDWDNYVASHPLEFQGQGAAPVAVDQKCKEVVMARTALADESLLNRLYTPQCPNCHAKYSKAPPEWDCPMCLRKFRQHVKCWQPDDTPSCGVCQCSVGRFTRHHCRNCGRVTCGKCSEFKVEIPSLGYKGTAVRACKQCIAQLAPHVLEAATAQK